MTHDEMIEKINYYDKTSYENDKKKTNIGITGFFYERERGKKIKNSTKEERIKYYENLLKIAEERKNKILKEEKETIKGPFAILAAGNYKIEKMHIENEINEIKKRIDREKGIISKEDLEFEKLMEDFLNGNYSSIYEEDEKFKAEEKKEKELLVNNLKSDIEKENKEEILHNNLENNTKEEKKKINPEYLLKANLVEINGKKYINGVEFKRMYSEEYGIFIDANNKYRNFKGEEIHNINGYLYICRGY